MTGETESDRVPGRIDRESEEDAAAVVRGLYPNDTERRKCLVKVSAAIKLLHDHPPDIWSITLQERRIVLNVGRLEAMNLLPRKLRLLAEKPRVPADIWALSLSIGGIPEAGLGTAPSL